MNYHADINQINVINAPIDSRLIVTAGPGSGKTFTAAQRLIRLVGEDSDGLNFLAVSFSRAAAQAIEDALTLAGLRGRVEIRTIDGWASRINREFADPDDIDQATTYDDRIKLAIRTIEENESAIQEVVDYLIVDEAQDIFDARSELIQQICTSSWITGWVVLGDLAQKIYDFVNESEVVGESLLESMSSKAEELEVEKHELITDFRCSNSELFRIRELGSEIRSSTAMRDHYSLWDEFTALHLLGSIDQLVGVLDAFASDDLSSAVLTRQNRLALEISYQLSEAGVPHRVIGGSNEYFVPDWVADLQECKSKSELLQSCPAYINRDLLAVEVTKLCAKGSSDSYDFRYLAEAIRSRKVPQVLLQGDRRGVTISSIHQSKGLEFDRVVLQTEKPLATNEDLLSETRVLFVGLTRAKADVLRFQMDKRIESRRSMDRSIDFIWRNTPRPVRIEIKPGDIQFLRQVQRGVRLEARLISVQNDQIPIYGLFEPDSKECLANISESFSKAVKMNWRTDLPGVFTGLYEIGEQTIARPLSYGDGDSRPHLVTVPVLRGMLEVEEK
jgi:superfamily I DNA/RNA helicase